MSVGGRIIEIMPMTLTLTEDAGTRPPDQMHVVRLWCVDRHGNETCVYAQPQDDMPRLGEEVWWQSRKIYYDRDKKYLTKIGASFSPERDV